MKRLTESNKSWAAFRGRLAWLPKGDGTTRRPWWSLSVLHRDSEEEVGWLSATATDCSTFADWSHVWNKCMHSLLCILHGAVEELSRNERFWLEIFLYCDVEVDLKLWGKYSPSIRASLVPTDFPAALVWLYNTIKWAYCNKSSP